MRLKDLTIPYRELYLNSNDRTAYEATDPELFDHYYTHWADRDKPPITLTETELTTRRDYVVDSLNRISPALQAAGLDRDQCELLLMVGQDRSNGHAYYKNGCFIPWVAVECYTSQLLADIFVLHEIVHAWHYNASPDFFFADQTEKDHSLRQLITEGLATWLTAEILGVSQSAALWADHMSDEAIIRWVSECETRQSEISGHLLESARTGESTQLFVLADPEDIMANRAGYYLGMKIMQRIASEQRLRPIEILNLPRPELEQLTLAFLKSNIA